MSVDIFSETSIPSISPGKKSKRLTYFVYCLISCIILYFIYLIQKHILYKTIYLLLYIISSIFHINLSPTIISFIALSIIIYLHIILFRIMVLSVVFLLGGLAKKIFIYFHCKTFISNLIRNISSLIVQIQTPNFDIACNKLSIIENFHRIYNSHKINGETFEINDAQFGEVLNDIMFSFNQLKEQINNNLSSINNYQNEYTLLVNKLQILKDILQKYEQFNYIGMLFKFNSHAFLKHIYQQYINDLFLKYKRNSTQLILKNNIHCLLIHPKNENEIHQSKVNHVKTLVIFCNQNAVCNEIYSCGDSNISYYLDIPSTTILLWNYAGYGTRSGFPSFKSIDKDVIELAKYINKEYSSYKIIVHGTSIGGYAAINLIQRLNDDLNTMLIADRTFGDIDLIVNSMQYGNILVKIYNLLFPKLLYNSSNVKTYINITTNNKLILYDENDTIIEYKASLITELTNTFWKDIVYYKLSDIVNSKWDQLKEFRYDLMSSYYTNKTEIWKLLIPENEINKFNNELEILYNAIDEDESYQIKEFIKKMLYDSNINSFIKDLFVYGIEVASYKEISPVKMERSYAYTCVPFVLQKLALNKHTGSSVFDFLVKLNYIYVKIMLNINSKINMRSDEYIEKFLYSSNDTAFYVKEEIETYLQRYFGYVHRIFCGHNGSLHKKDIEYLYNVLKDKDFINDELNNDVDEGIIN